MATAKKTPVKKTAAKSAPKKTTVRKKASTTKKSTKQTPKPVDSKSFRIQSESQPFLTFKVTHQTIYWAIFSVVVLALSLWVMKLHMAVEELYNTIDYNHALYESTDAMIQAKIEAKK